MNISFRTGDRARIVGVVALAALVGGCGGSSPTKPTTGSGGSAAGSNGSGGAAGSGGSAAGSNGSGGAAGGSAGSGGGGHGSAGSGGTAGHGGAAGSGGTAGHSGVAGSGGGAGAGPTCAPDAGSGLLISNPIPVQTTMSNGLALLKNLDAYPNYGPTGADILYDGQVGTWTFTVPPVNIVSATVVVSIIADDHPDTPISDYSFTLTLGSGVTYPGIALPHGAPYNSHFTNWVSMTEPATPSSGSCFTVTIANTSATGSPGNWIAIESIELDLVTQ